MCEAVAANTSQSLWIKLSLEVLRIVDWAFVLQFFELLSTSLTSITRVFWLFVYKVSTIGHSLK